MATSRKKKPASPAPNVSTTKRIGVMTTAFRDGFQSVFGARVLTEDFLPAVEATREAGVTHFEAGGGARFQSLYFYCNEDAFAMMDRFREAAGPDANLQTLARGVNVVGLESQSSDIIDLHAKLFKKHGITTIRNFDALNDVNNLIHSGRCITGAGLNHEVCVTMMELPPGCEGAHDPQFYLETLRGILDADIPYTSVCFKDASGTSVPSKIYETLRGARQMLPEGTHIRFHTHDTAGIAIAGYRAALDAGVDGVDLSMAPCSGGTCQPDIAVLWHALRGSAFQLDVDIDKIMQAELVLRECMRDYFVPPEALAVEPMIPWSPMPGGALTANTQMMRDHGIMDRYPEVIHAMSEVVRKGGFGTSVTPVSQFYFQQAFNNVMFGPWERMAESYGRMVLGYFGKTPVPPDPEVVRIASEQLGLEPATRSPLEENDANPAKGIEAARKMLQENGIEETDEHIFIAATCKDKGIAFLRGEAKQNVRKGEPNRTGTRPDEVDEMLRERVPVRVNIAVGDQNFAVELCDGKAVVRDSAFAMSGAPAPKQAESKPAAPPAAAPSPAPAAVPADPKAISAPLPGAVIRVCVAEGDAVEKGQAVVVLEAMKMEAEVKAPAAGRIAKIHVAQGDQVSANQAVAHMA